jgi:hypothetical protein
MSQNFQKLFLLVLIILGCDRVDLLSPESVVKSYINATMENDIRMLSLLETGDEKIFDQTFGVLSGPISERMRRNAIEDKAEYFWEIEGIIYKNKTAEVQIFFRTPDFSKIANRVLQYMGYKKVEGRLQAGEPIKPGLTTEEARKMARADPDIKPLEYNVIITLEKTANGWIVLPMKSKAFMRIFYPFDKQYEEK